MAAIYLNTDLHLKARFNLGPLAEALESAGLFVLNTPRPRGGTWTASFETSLVRPTPERAAVSFLKVIGDLEGDARLAWEACTSREFDLGFEWTGASRSMQSTIASKDILAKIAAFGISMRVTIYSPR